MEKIDINGTEIYPQLIHFSGELKIHTNPDNPEYSLEELREINPFRPLDSILSPMIPGGSVWRFIRSYNRKKKQNESYPWGYRKYFGIQSM